MDDVLSIKQLEELLLEKGSLKARLEKAEAELAKVKEENSRMIKALAREGIPELTFDDYQVQALAGTTNCYPAEQMTAWLLAGLASEAGEVAGKFKKALRDGGDARQAMVAEIGDVLWYCACLARECGVSLEMVARANLEKLADRAARGKIGGSGDER